MADDIYIKLSELEDVAAQLSGIVEEFEQASSRADVLEAAIGDPFGRNELREKAEDFEDRWDKKRGQLKDALAGILEHVNGVVENVTQADADMAIALTPED